VQLQDSGCGAINLLLLGSVLLTPDAVLWTLVAVAYVIPLKDPLERSLGYDASFLEGRFGFAQFYHTQSFAHAGGIALVFS
jgi:hypothetical protein